jgi:hypothetical protein
MVIGDVECHINGDTMLLTSYVGFDRLYAITTENRVELKKKMFDGLPKIQIIGFPEKHKQ